MTTSSSRKKAAALALLKSSQAQQRKAASLASATAAAAVSLASVSSLINSILTGHAWVRELLCGHPRQFHNMMGLSKPVFRRLLQELKDHAGFCHSKHIS
ncbi:hypothetical protein SERLA73DRAFT_178441, partial [Serpula lacrymans var. lacrymans S7.3]